MSKFKFGDRVRCTYAGGSYFTVGKVYVVMRVIGMTFSVQDNDGKDTVIIDSQFELVTDTPCPDPVEWLKEQIRDPGWTDVPKEAFKLVLREIYGIDAKVVTVTRTEWTFEPVSP